MYTFQVIILKGKHQFKKKPDQKGSGEDEGDKESKEEEEEEGKVANRKKKKQQVEPKVDEKLSFSSNSSKGKCIF